MQFKYRTSNKGIAAYLITKGYEVLRVTEDKNRQGKLCMYIEFDIDQTTGKNLGDTFFNGEAKGDLKAFNDACYEVRQLIYKARNN